MVHPNLLAVIPEVQKLVVPAKVGGTVGRGTGEASLSYTLPRNRPQDVEATPNGHPRVGRIAFQLGGPYDDPVWAVKDCSAVGSVIHPHNRADECVGRVNRATDLAVWRRLGIGVARGRKPKGGKHIRPVGRPKATVVRRNVVEFAQCRVGANVGRGKAAPNACARRDHHVGPAHGLSRFAGRCGQAEE